MRKSLLLLALVLSVCATPATAEGLSAWMQHIQTTMSSFKAFTAQANVSGRRRDAMRLQASQAMASAAAERSDAVQIRKAWEDYGPDGQLSDPCYQMHLSDKAGVVVGKTDASAQRAADLVYRTGVAGNRSSGGVSGAFGGTVRASNVPFSLQVAEREDRHKGKYCSVAEAQAGYCQLTPTGMQSGDSDFSLHLPPGKTFGWDQTEAATDFVKTVAPLKTAQVGNPRNCTDPSCQMALVAVRQEPMMSMARYSLLRFVESRTSQAVGDAKQPVSGN